jgi:hypothetical protein
MKRAYDDIENINYERYRDVMDEADDCKEELSILRKKLFDRVQEAESTQILQVTLVYLNMLQESQEFLSIMRHQLRATKKFVEN